MTERETNELIHPLWRTASALLVVVAVSGSGPALAGEGDADALREPVSREARVLDEIERQIEAIEKHRRTTRLARSGAKPVDLRVALLARRLEGLAAYTEPGLLELANRAAALLSRLDGVSKSPRRSSSPGPGFGAAPANDTCLTATAIGNGTFMGNTVDAGTDGGASCGSSDFSPDVWFEYTAPAAGEVFFNTFGSSFDTVLSLHSSPCGGAEIDCNDDAGSSQSELIETVTASQVVHVRVSGYGGDAGTFVLNTGLTGSISGTLTEEGSGTPLGSGKVTIFRAQGGLLENMGNDSAAANGTYAVGGLSPGEYRALGGASTYVTEIYDDLPCQRVAINSCFLERGAAITVTANTDTSMIDFELEPGGSISGTATNGGSPNAFPNVGVYDASGFLVRNNIGEPDGTYKVGRLPDGQYFVATREISSPWANELYDDLDCPGGGDAEACPLRAGTPVTVTAPNETPGIDFDLALGGSISGTVTEAGSGTDLEDVFVFIYDAKGRFVDSDTTAADGEYEVTGLHSGSYRASTVFSFPHVDEVWDNVSCYDAPNGCEATVGVLISVTAPSATTGIDFALVPGGSVSGTVTEQGSAMTLPNISVELYSPGGELLGSDLTTGDGSFEIAGLPSGSYRVQTIDSAPHADELYDDISCPGGYCDVAPGTAVAVVAPAATTGIDFVLSVGGAIRGTITENGTATPLNGVTVSVFDAAGDQAGRGSSAADGSYTVGGLPTGTYYASTTDAPLHLDELHAGIPCPGGGGFGCDATTGSAIGVTAPGVVTGIDFALAAGGTIQGSVLDAVTLLPLDLEPDVEIYSAAGMLLTVARTNGTGDYSTSGLPTGTYFARVDNFSSYQDLRYDVLSCAGSCDSELGMPIPVVFPANASGVNFRLYQPGADPDLVLSKEDLSTDANFCAQGSITLGPDFEVQGSANVSFLSDLVVFESGFGTGADTQVTVGGNPPPVCD